MINQNGNTLLEILIALGLFSLAVLSLAHLQWVSVQRLREAYEVILPLNLTTNE